MNEDRIVKASLINSDISDIGKKMLNFQEELSKTYHYKPLPKDVEKKTLSTYLDNLPQGISKIIDTGSECVLKPGFEMYSKEVFPIFSRNGTEIAKGFERIVIGHYGAFIEIRHSDMLLQNLKVKEGQEYRINDEKYAKHVKYHWYTTKDESDCKLYYQQNSVTYADYKTGYWYISPYEILDKEELFLFLSYKRNKNVFIDKKKEVIGDMRDLNFLPKPDGYKTVHQWAKEGKAPVSSAVVEEYAAVTASGGIMLKDWSKPISRDNVYIHEYVAPENVVSMKKERKLFSFDEMLGSKIVCFDTETTGFSKWDEIIQISVFELDTETLKIKEILSTYIKPENKKSWPEASKINGIYPEDVKKAPKMKDIQNKLKEIFNSADIICGHNISFDIRMLEQCSKVKLDGKIIADTLQLFRNEVPEGRHSLSDAVDYYIPHRKEWFVKGAHKADTDTRATLEILKEMYFRHKEMYQLTKKDEDKIRWMRNECAAKLEINGDILSKEEKEKYESELKKLDEALEYLEEIERD